MSNTWETAAIIRLVDHLSGPLKTLAGTVDRQSAGIAASLHRSGTKMADIGRSMTFGLSLPLAELGKKMTEQAVGFSKVENTLQGVLLNRARTLKDLKTSYDAYAASQTKIMKDDAATAYSRTGGLANVLEYQRSQMEAIKSGHDAMAANAIATQGTYLGIAGRVSQGEATEDLIKIGMAFGVVTKNADGTSKSVAELNTQFGEISDLLATMPTNAAMSYREGVESLKLSAPYAHLLHFDPGILGAMSEAMSDQGIRGSEASVAQRSFFQSLLGPKSTTVSTLEAAGVKYYDYAKFAPDFQLTPESFARYAQRNGYEISAARARQAFAKARSQQDSSGGENDWLNDLSQDLTGALMHHGGKHTLLAPEAVSKFTTNWMSTGVQSMNALGLILAMRDMHGGTGPTAGEWKKIGEGRQYTRLSAVLNPKGDGAVDPFNLSMGRLFGDDWREKAKSGQLNAAYFGNAMRQAQEHARKLEGAMTILSNSFVNLNSALYDAGVYDNIASGMRNVAAAVTAISKMDPATLKGVATGLMALAAAGPALWIGGRLIAIAAGLTKLSAAVLGFKALESAAGVSIVAPGRRLPGGAPIAPTEPTGRLVWLGSVLEAAARATSLATIPLLASTSALNDGENELQRQEDMRRGKFSRGLHAFNINGPIAPAMPDSGLYLNGRNAPSTQPIGPASSTPLMVKVTPIDVRGEAEVMVTSHLVVDPSPNFITKVIDAAVQRVKLNLGQTMSGSQAPAHVQDIINGAAMP